MAVCAGMNFVMVYKRLDRKSLVIEAGAETAFCCHAWREKTKRKPKESQVIQNYEWKEVMFDSRIMMCSKLWIFYLLYLQATGGMFFPSCM